MSWQQCFENCKCVEMVKGPSRRPRREEEKEKHSEPRECRGGVQKREEGEGGRKGKGWVQDTIFLFLTFYFFPFSSLFTFIFFNSAFQIRYIKMTFFLF